MVPTATDDSVSTFKDGKLMPGIYKIQNIVGQTYLEVRDHSKQLCCRPASALEDGNGLWEIRPSGPGYTIRKFEPGKPNQFCMMVCGLGNGSSISVTAFPVAWRVEVVNEKKYCGWDYVRFFWGMTNMTWDLAGSGSSEDHTRLHLEDNHDNNPCRIWKLIPMKFDIGSQPLLEANSVPATGSSSLPPYNVNPSDQHCTCSLQTVGTSDDKFGTTVIEVTTITTTKTVTTQKNHRVGGE